MNRGGLERAFTYLESGPVILVTSSLDGRDDIMTISWHMVMDFTPHIAITTGTWNESYQRIIDTKQCVVCVPGVDLLDSAIRIGTTSGSRTDKFAENGLTKLPADSVDAPLIGECLACIECELTDMVHEHGILIFRGVRLWENEEREERRTFHANGDGTFFADGELLRRRDDMREWIPDGCERL